MRVAWLHPISHRTHALYSKMKSASPNSYCLHAFVWVMSAIKVAETPDLETSSCDSSLVRGVKLVCLVCDAEVFLAPFVNQFLLQIERIT